MTETRSSKREIRIRLLTYVTDSKSEDILFQHCHVSTRLPVILREDGQTNWNE